MRRHLFALGLVATLALAACGGGATASPAATSGPPAASTPPAAESPAGADNAVSIAGFAFHPATLPVSAGATVTWTNADSTNHSVAWKDGTAGSDSLAAGASYSRTFDTPGTFAYACGIHPSMTGTVVVQP